MAHPQQRGFGIVRIGRQRADARQLPVPEGGEQSKTVVAGGILARQPFLAQALDEAIGLGARLAAQLLEIVRQRLAEPDDLDRRFAHRPSNSALEM